MKQEHYAIEEEQERGLTFKNDMHIHMTHAHMFICVCVFIRKLRNSKNIEHKDKGYGKPKRKSKKII